MLAIIKNAHSAGCGQYADACAPLPPPHTNHIVCCRLMGIQAGVHRHKRNPQASDQTTESFLPWRRCGDLRYNHMATGPAATDRCWAAMSCKAGGTFPPVTAGAAAKVRRWGANKLGHERHNQLLPRNFCKHARSYAYIVL